MLSEEQNTLTSHIEDHNHKDPSQPEDLKKTEERRLNDSSLSVAALEKEERMMLSPLLVTASKRLATTSSSSSSVRSILARGGGGGESSLCTLIGRRRYRISSTIQNARPLVSVARAELPQGGSSVAVSRSSNRMFSSSTENAAPEVQDDELQQSPRECMSFDVLIVGGGPAGLAAAIRLKQLCAKKGTDLSVCLIDKGSEIGAHILSGNVLDPKAMHELFPDQADASQENHWTKELLERQGSYATPVQDDEFLILTQGGGAHKIPNFLLPPQLHNHGNYIISLSQLCRYLASKAEELGVEIYPGFAASEVLIRKENDNGSNGGACYGIATRDVGIDKHGKPKDTFERGVELQARQTLFAEGARGSCSEWLMDHYGLRGKAQAQTYGLGLKEVWQVPEEKFQAGLVQHTLGYPLQSGPLDKVFGGSFLYHQEPDLVLVGFVIGLDYANPYINPYQEFQQWKTHPAIRKHLEGGTCLSYGARVLNEGGLHAIPEKYTFPGGALIGCSAGFLNAVKIKGTHTALKSGMLAAESIVEALLKDDAVPSVAETGELPESSTPPVEITSYQTAVEKSWIRDELYQVRNCHQAFAKWGVLGGLAYSGLAAHVTKGREPWTLKDHGKDCDQTAMAANVQPKEYPAPDGKLTFDLLTNLQRSGTYHAEDQPAHLRIKPNLADIPKNVSLQKYAGPEQRFCPAGVYEYVEDDATKKEQLVINAQNCIHCKCCSIKMPSEYIDWTVPEGGGGPQYQIM